MKRLKLLLLVMVAVCAAGQRPQVFDANIRSLMQECNLRQSIVPVLRMGTDDVLKVSFDDLMHNYRRFSYRIEHVGNDFITNEGLFDSEFMYADDDFIVLEEYEQSFNTSVLYNHYQIMLPNPSMRPLLSGNYRLVVCVEDEEGDRQKAFVSYFAVAEQVAGITLSATANTDIDFNATHQQLTLQVDHSALAVRDVSEDFVTVVVQNQRWDEARRLRRPTQQSARSMRWEHARELVFKAGNEYRKFEQQSVRYPGMHVENVRFYDPYYYTTLMTDLPRRHYIYDEDQNGKFVPRTDDSGNPDTESEYVWMHFSLQADSIPGVEMYLNGLWTCGNFSPEYRMHYNVATGCYEALVFLKQGYYSYQYLAVKDGVGKTAAVEGDFHETENEYDVFVYYRKPGDRYDRLVGWRTASYRKK